MVEYNTSTTMYATMSSDITSNSGKCIQVDQGSVSSIAKSSFQYLAKSLVQAQSNIDKSNRDVFVIVVDNTTPKFKKFFSHCFMERIIALKINILFLTDFHLDIVHIRQVVE
jgi:hypothetical protein